MSEEAGGSDEDCVFNGRRDVVSMASRFEKACGRSRMQTFTNARARRYLCFQNWSIGCIRCGHIRGCGWLERTGVAVKARASAKMSEKCKSQGETKAWASWRQS